MGKKTIYLEDAINALHNEIVKRRISEDVNDDGSLDEFDTESILRRLQPAQPDNQIHLCDSCGYSYPECPSESNDVIFGNGNGNDNICACGKYKPSAQKKGYTKADYIMALHKEYGCSLARAEEAHQKSLEYLRNTSMIKG